MIAVIKELVARLNRYRDQYYNNQISEVTDFEYDRLFDELKKIEDETGIILSNSPTQTVGYEVKSVLDKVTHSHPMLSLDKTKAVDDLKVFADDKDCLLSLKLDGLTVLLTYENGKLVRAETRGNGEVGEDITHNAKVFENIPLTISYTEHLEVEGEAVITYNDFDNINAKIDGEKYKNPRNLVSGSVRQLDSNIAAERHIRFIAWKVPSEIKKEEVNNTSYLNKLIYLKKFGFDIVPLLTYVNGTYDEEHIDDMIEALKNAAKEMQYPIDGLVMTYDDINYAESLGMTGHHPKHSIAFKFYDEEVETILKDIEWTMGKTGVLTPTAVFEPVEIDGTIVERASLHNISVMQELYPKTWYSGFIVTVYKANQIIPQISKVEAKSYSKAKRLNIPYICPICKGATAVRQDNSSKVLICTNDDCDGKLLGKLTHFVSKNAMDISGLSEATLQKLVELGWVSSFKDIYNLDKYYTNMIELDGFGEKSVDNLLNAIKLSKNTTLDRFIYALCIPLIGRSASKTISKYFNGSFDRFYDECCLNPVGFRFENLEDFGVSMSESIDVYLRDNSDMIKELAGYIGFQNNQTVNTSSVDLTGKTFVITGSLIHFKNRDEAKEKIESLGGKVSGSVSTKTSYLVNNDIASTSGKNKKAKELNIPIITEDKLLEMINN